MQLTQWQEQNPEEARRREEEVAHRKSVLGVIDTEGEVRDTRTKNQKKETLPGCSCMRTLQKIAYSSVGRVGDHALWHYSQEDKEDIFQQTVERLVTVPLVRMPTEEERQQQLDRLAPGEPDLGPVPIATGWWKDLDVEDMIRCFRVLVKCKAWDLLKTSGRRTKREMTSDMPKAGHGGDWVCSRPERTLDQAESQKYLREVLTGRTWQVAQDILAGYNQKETAKNLRVSVKTIKREYARLREVLSARLVEDPILQ